jgi:phospholipid/cholesterol/gamma-HCH transport system ATP-binding protein
MIHDGRIVEVDAPSEIKASRNPIVKGFIYTTTKGIKGDVNTNLISRTVQD